MKQLELVTWIDAEADVGWEDETGDTPWKASPALCCSIGWIVFESEALLTLASTKGHETGHTNRITLPKGMIQSRRAVDVQQPGEHPT